MSRRKVMIAGMMALAALVAWPETSQAQYGGCSTCATVPAYRPMVVRYGLFGRPRAVYYAPTVVAAPVASYYAPVASYYTPVASYYRPVASYYAPTAAYYAPAASACNTCSTSVMYPTSSCSTCYSPTIVNTPVTTYRPVAACGPCGNTVTYMRPVTSYVQRVQYTPQTVCSPVSVSYAPAACAPGCTGCVQCAPTATQYAPTTTQYAPSTYQDQQQAPNSYPQTQPGYGNPGPAPESYRGERPQTSSDPASQTNPPHTYQNAPQNSAPHTSAPRTSAPQQPIPQQQPQTSSGSSSYYQNNDPQLIDPESRTTQSLRSWDFHRAVAQEKDLSARIIPVSQSAPAAQQQPAANGSTSSNSGWRAARPR